MTTALQLAAALRYIDQSAAEFPMTTIEFLNTGIDQLNEGAWRGEIDLEILADALADAMHAPGFFAGSIEQMCEFFETLLSVDALQRAGRPVVDCDTCTRGCNCEVGSHGCEHFACWGKDTETTCPAAEPLRTHLIARHPELASIA